MLSLPRLIDRPDHVQGCLGKIVQLVIQDSLAAIQRIGKTHRSSWKSAELRGREERLSQKSFEAPCTADRVAILAGELLEAEHGNDVLELFILGQGAPDLLREAVVALARDSRSEHF